MIVQPGITSNISLQLVPTTGRIVICCNVGNTRSRSFLLFFTTHLMEMQMMSGHNHNGVVHNATLVPDRFGIPTRLTYSMVYRRIKCGLDSALNPAMGPPISAWVRYTGGPSYKNIFSRWDVFDGVDERTYGLNVDANNRLGFWISPDGTHWSSVLLLILCALGRLDAYCGHLGWNDNAALQEWQPGH